MATTATDDTCYHFQTPSTVANNRVLHICALDSVNAIFPPFISFVREHFDSSDHLFLTWGEVEELPYEEGSDTLHLDSLRRHWIRFCLELRRAKKIIIHGLFSAKIVQALFLQPWLLKKCYWVMWGGDLYSERPPGVSWKQSAHNFAWTRVVRNMGHLVSFIKGDYELASQLYGAQGSYVECFMYPRNIYKEIGDRTKNIAKTVLVGNSAKSSNNHFQVFEQLAQFHDQQLRVICPLSYGNKDYARKVVAMGKRYFDGGFQPLLEFMSFDEYLDVLREVDVAIFAHKRQQAMGNTIMLLGLGKKVFMRHDVTPVRFFEQIGVKVFDVDNIDLDPMPTHIAVENADAVKSYFSEENLVIQLGRIFSD